MASTGVSSGPGGGGLIKSNYSSADNTLAFPSGAGGNAYQSSMPNPNNPPSIVAQPKPNPGGILKSNYSSSDNPLAFSGYYNNKNASNENLNSYQTSQSPYGSSNNVNYNNNNNNLDSYLRPSDNKPNDFSGYSSAPAQSQPYQPNYPNNFPESAKPNYPSFDQNPYSPKRDSDIRFDIDAANKQAYKRALDQQVAEKEIAKYKDEKANKRSELDTLRQYPFGRRADPATYISEEHKYMPVAQPYIPTVRPPQQLQQPFYEEQAFRLNKDNIVEKPNSLSADIPPYDPIKHRNGNYQGYNYDPWGKPGGGAPLIDSNTGRKFTKYSGQLWYDTIGLSPDDRAKMYADKNRPLTLEEQKVEMEQEKERRKFEEAVYKSRAGDVATWITDIEKQRKIYNTTQAHLPHTSVTREKINLESVRRYNVRDDTHNPQKYHDILGQQLEERNRQNKLFKLKDDVAGIEHTKKWDDWVSFEKSFVYELFFFNLN